MDLEALATMVDDLVHVPGADRLDARLYGVRLFDDVGAVLAAVGDAGGGGDGGGGGDSGPGRRSHPESGGPGRVLLDELARGYAREIPRRVRPPAGLAAIALATTGWGAPMADDGTMSARPSLHPSRRRIHVTALVGGDGEDCSVIRFGDDEPLLVRGGIGYVHDLLLRCWSRRADAPDRRLRGRVAAPARPW